MPDTSAIDIVSTRKLTSGKKFPTTSAFAGLTADDYTVLGSPPLFHVDALDVDGC